MRYYLQMPNIFLQAMLISIELRTCDWAQLYSYWKYDTKGFTVVIVTITVVAFGSNASAVFAGIFTFLV